MKQAHLNIGIAIWLIALAVLMRILPHPANFAPVAAVAIFGGSILPRRLAILVPLLAMMFSDAIIGWHSLIPLTWGCYALIALASSHWLRKPSIRRGVIITLSGSTLFFVVTNFGVWLWSSMYAHTWSGLALCYTMALPFFRNTLLSDMLYTSALFGLYALAAGMSYRLLKPGLRADI
jgi:hypothetical protein